MHPLSSLHLTLFFSVSFIQLESRISVLLPVNTTPQMKSISIIQMAFFMTSPKVVLYWMTITTKRTPSIIFAFALCRCRILNLHRNHLVCLRQLPKLPAVEHLCLSENAISSLQGLGALESSPLRSLNLTHNPVTFTQDYRARWGDSNSRE